MGLAQAAYDFTGRSYLDAANCPACRRVKRRMFPTKQIAVAEMRIMLEPDQGAVVPGITEARANPSKDQDTACLCGATHRVMENANTSR